jgi:hypothetical protein
MSGSGIIEEKDGLDGRPDGDGPDQVEQADHPPPTHSSTERTRSDDRYDEPCDP